MFSKVNSMGLSGFKAERVFVECDLSAGLPRFDLVGLPDSAVSEAKERVRSAIKNCNLDFPISRITVNLAPAEFRKEGPVYDLPILVAVLLSSGQLKTDLSGSALFGEVALDGGIRKVNGALPMVARAKECGITEVFIPYDNREEAALIPGIRIYPVKTVSELLDHLKGTAPIAPVEPLTFEEIAVKAGASAAKSVDFSDVKGQKCAKRALEIAAAGGHNVLLVGSPVAGKSMLAKRLPTILPDMTFEESLATSSVYSVAGLLTKETPLIISRPFRAPHHTTTDVAFAGGGTKARPGEISLAHNGVLFLDELPLFSRAALETLRQPLEDGKVTVTRNAVTATYPGSIMLVCAMNPCPCGYLYDPVHECRCSDAAKKRYNARVSGPLLDRIDIHVQVDPLDAEALYGKPAEPEESSSEIRARVMAARAVQSARFEGTEVTCNAQMTPRMVRRFCIMTPQAKNFLIRAFTQMKFSARANDKILRTARTIADLAGSDLIDTPHISEAIQYRRMDAFEG